MQHQGYFLSRLVGDKTFRNFLISINDDITEPIYSYISDNSNETAKQVILKFIDQNISKLSNFVPNNINPQENNQTNNNQPINMIGEIVEIDASHENYTSLLQHAQKNRWIYRGLTILEKSIKDENGNVKLVWNIFFY